MEDKEQKFSTKEVAKSVGDVKVITSEPMPIDVPQEVEVKPKAEKQN